MNGIAPVENGLVRSRATSRPASSTMAKFGSCPSPTGLGDEPIRFTAPSPVERVRVHARAGGPPLALDLELGLVRLVAEQVELLEARLETELPKRLGDEVGGPRGFVAPGRARADVDCERLDQVHRAESRRGGHEYDHRVRPRPARLERLPAAVLRRAARPRRRRGCRGRPAARRPRPRQPRARPARACRRGARRLARGARTSTATRRSAGSRARARRSPRATATSTASSSIPSARSRCSRGRRPAIVELSLVLADEGDTVLLPDPYYPDYPSGPAFAGARLETFPLDADAGWAPAPRRRRRGRGALPQLPVEPVRGLRARRACSPTRCAGRSGPAARSSTTRRTSTSSTTAARRRASSRRRARRTSASRCGRCRRRTAWRAGASASSSGTPRSSSASTS